MGGHTNKYDGDLKKSIVNLYQSGKSQTQLSKEYGISLNTMGKWIKFPALGSNILLLKVCVGGISVVKLRPFL